MGDWETGNSSDTERLKSIRGFLESRERIIAALREFFRDHDFLEVTTPVRIPSPALEEHIDAEPCGDRYLRTSPELHMKRMLAAGYERLFQIGPCFRKGERGTRHLPEFTMLEWYRANAGSAEMLLDTKALIIRAARSVPGRTQIVYQGQAIDLEPVWECISVSEAFIQHAGWDPVLHFDQDRFDIDLVEKVEPQLPRGVPVVLKDYPREAAALARTRPDNPRVAERWELYIGGMELANAFSELTDAAEQRRRFEDCARKRRAAGRDVYPIDEAFMESLGRGLPPSGGIALGLDRLVMLLTDAPAIDEVVAFESQP